MAELESLPRSLPDEIPPLEMALQLAVGLGELFVLRYRAKKLSKMQVPIGFLKYAYGFKYAFNEPTAILVHEPASSIEGKDEILFRERGIIAQQLDSVQTPESIKTVTLGYKRQGMESYVLVTGEGDFRIEEPIKAKIADGLGLPHTVLRNTTINPKKADPELLLGLIPGIVGPFIRNDLASSYLLEGVFLSSAKASRGFRFRKICSSSSIPMGNNNT